MKERFPLWNTAFQGKIYTILDGNGDRCAEVSAGDAQAAIEEAKANWPESRSAVIRNELALPAVGRNV